MSEPAKKRASYQDLFNLPENMTGQIIDGELIVTPRPSRKHVFAATTLGSKVTTTYHFGEGVGLVAGSSSLTPRLRWVKTSWFLTWQGGRRKGFRRRKIITGSRWFRTGFAKSFHRIPQRPIRPKKCRSMLATASAVFGSSILWPERWMFTDWKPADGWLWGSMPKKTPFAPNLSRRWRSPLPAFGWEKGRHDLYDERHPFMLRSGFDFLSGLIIIHRAIAGCGHPLGRCQEISAPR